MLINNVACHIRVYNIHVLSSFSCTLHLNDMKIRWFYLMPEQDILNRWNHSPPEDVGLERRRPCVYSSIWIIISLRRSVYMYSLVEWLHVYMRAKSSRSSISPRSFDFHEILTASFILMFCVKILKIEASFSSFRNSWAGSDEFLSVGVVLICSCKCCSCKLDFFF